MICRIHLLSKTPISVFLYMRDGWIVEETKRKCGCKSTRRVKKYAPIHLDDYAPRLVRPLVRGRSSPHS